MSYIGLNISLMGQDASYMADLLLSKGYKVWALIRKTTSIIEKHQNVCHLIDNPNLTIRYGDLNDSSSISTVIQEIKNTYPDLIRLEIYNFGAISHVGISFKLPELTVSTNALGPLRVLEAIRQSGYQDKIRFLNCCSSEQYGAVLETPQNEKTPFNPRSVYAASKAFAYYMTKNYREAYNIFACNSICFNHDSSRRDPIFVTRKITKGIADIVHGRSQKLILGNINSFRDITHAKDCVRAMFMMMNHNEPDDFVISSDQTHCIREFIEKAFLLKGFNIKWKGEGLDEIGYDENTGRELIFISEEFFRPTEVDLLLGDSTKARTILGWKPEYSFDDLIKEMVEHDDV
jgi:GDPmannose 4,6-dehydratase